MLTMAMLTMAMLTMAMLTMHVQVASGVAEGMAYLHSERVMHRDLKVSK